ncbi:MAG: signal recognition particle-docking protein FtsY [Proteobacteria bacterium]|nr:signal recognition particle-docking protein FtsY [Pseudomonadota bacterium]
MSLNLVIGIVAGLAVIIVILLLLRGKKKGPGEAAPLGVDRPKEEPPAVPVAEPKRDASRAVPAAEVSPPVPPVAEAPVVEAVPEVEAPEGVRLDEEEEAEAVARLEKQRQERKIQRLRKGLAPTRGGLIAKLGALFKGKKEIDPSLMEELEETLIMSDVGSQTSAMLIDILKSALDKDELADSEAIWELLREEIRQVLSVECEPINLDADKPYTIMVAGVNGVGKTTTIGKLATNYIAQGRKVVLAAADTFRAAAVNQLEIWGRRAGAEVVKSKEGADPSSVVYDAIKHAKENGADIVIADTAGRLHTKVPLMEEIKKIARVMGKAHENAPHQVLLVLDATTGQNAVSQVAMFKETLDVSGLVVTKLDGTAKGGVIIGICHEHKLPIRFIGIGEAKDDLREFEVDDFVEALFAEQNGDREK